MNSIVKITTGGREVHYRAGAKDYRSPQDALVGEAVWIAFWVSPRCRATAVFALQADESAQGNPVDGVGRLAVLQSEDTRRKTETKLVDSDTEALSGDEVT